MARECLPRIKEFDKRKMAKRLEPGRKVIVTFLLSKRANVEWCDIVQTLWPCDKNVTQGSLVTISWGALWHCCGTVWHRVALCIIVHSETVCGCGIAWHFGIVVHCVIVWDRCQRCSSPCRTRGHTIAMWRKLLPRISPTLDYIALVCFTQNRRRNYMWEAISYIGS